MLACLSLPSTGAAVWSVALLVGGLLDSSFRDADDSPSSTSHLLSKREPVLHRCCCCFHPVWGSLVFHFGTPAVFSHRYAASQTCRYVDSHFIRYAAIHLKRYAANLSCRYAGYRADSGLSHQAARTQADSGLSHQAAWSQAGSGLSHQTAWQRAGSGLSHQTAP